MSQSPADLQQLLQSVAQGQLSPDQAAQQLQQLSFETVGDFAKVDHDRGRRTGFPEVIWGQDKPPEQIAQIMAAMHDRPIVDRAPVIMATRIDPAKAEWIAQMLPVVRYYDRARICAIVQPDQQPHRIGNIGILTAGTADLPIAEEAAVTAELCGFRVERLWDVGVAGIQRLLSQRAVLDRADVLIVVAGMEGALPSVVGGLVDCPIIAVPTSIGYGASFNGLAPLLGMLNSCAAGLGVVNIDNGFGAAILAGQILRTAEKLSDR